MSDQILTASIQTRLALDEMKYRVGRRLGEEHGQTAAEYMGILLVVAVLIAAVLASGADDTIKTKTKEIVDSISTGGKDNPK